MTANEIKLSELKKIHAMSVFMTSEDGIEDQDPSMVIEMVECMLSDLIANGRTYPSWTYIATYCDVIDGADQARELGDRFDATESEW